MLLFKVEDGLVKPFETTLLIVSFRKLWDRDTTKNKEIVSKEFAYIYFYCSYSEDNPYIGYTDDEVRSRKIIEGLFKDVDQWQPDELVEDGIMQFKEFQNNASPSLAYFHSTRVALDKLREYWETLDMTKTTRSGQLLNKPSDVARGIEQTSSLLVKMADLELKVKQELMSQGKTRGNRTINYFEKAPR